MGVIGGVVTAVVAAGVPASMAVATKAAVTASVERTRVRRFGIFSLENALIVASAHPELLVTITYFALLLQGYGYPGHTMPYFLVFLEGPFS
jgi:hypothetical protein